MGRKKKRTISPEHLLKMQEGRKKAQAIRERTKRLDERGLAKAAPMGYTERLLSQVKRKRGGRK